MAVRVRNNAGRRSSRPDPSGSGSPDGDVSRSSKLQSATMIKPVAKAAQENADNRVTQLFNEMMSVLNVVFGVKMMVTLSLLHVIFVANLHENSLWFTNIAPVEREISFRTESGLYYSYYKQLVETPSIREGVLRLTRDNFTEHGKTVNLLSRFNIYQEVVLAAMYKTFKFKVEPIFFYVYSIFALQAVLISAIYATSWLLSGSWVAASLTATIYIMNRPDTTRVNFTAPLRESFALPFLWAQLFFITCYLRHVGSTWKKNAYLTLAGISQFCFVLFWQFAPFIMFLQAFALYGLALVNLLQLRKLVTIYRLMFVIFLLVFAVQFGNDMIITSQLMVFMPAALLILAMKGHGSSQGIMTNIFMTIQYVGITFLLASLINRIIRSLIRHQSDAHVFQFILHKIGFGDRRNFDAMLYVCAGAFDWLPSDVYSRLISSWLLPLYVPGHLWLIYTVIRTLFSRWSAKRQPTEKEQLENKCASTESDESSMIEPDLVFHAVLSVLFAIIGISTLRFKYLWTTYMCIYAGYAATHSRLYSGLVNYLQLQGWAARMLRHCVGAIILAGIVLNNLPAVRSELDDLREFYDPDTVELMEWIKSSTPRSAAFSGSMQLLASVKLCTGRPLTNHPHFEDHELRTRTKTLYFFYGRTTPEQMHGILVQYDASYFILEDSICLANSSGCRVPDIVDMSRGQIPDNGDDYGGLLVKSTVPRFCHEIRYGRREYAKYFKPVFSNRTFRVYKVKKRENKK